MAWAKIPDYQTKIFQNYQHRKNYLIFYFHTDKKIISVGSCWEYKEDMGEKTRKIKNLVKRYLLLQKKLSYHGLKKAEKYDATFTWFRIFYVYGDTKRVAQSTDFNYKNKKNFF